MSAPKPVVSVITPVYNTADYLEECIRSVLAQSYDNFEYVIVNNCSTDGSEQIAARYAAQDPRVRLVNNTTFLSQVENYNHALRQASPEAPFIKMVQADDWLFRDCLERMVGVAQRSANIGMVGAYQLSGVHVKCHGLECAGPEADVTVVPGRDACRLLFLKRQYVFGTPTQLLYNAELVRSRHDFFIDGSYFEDSEICFEMLANCDFGFVHQVLTYTRVGNDSITTRATEFQPDVLHNYMIAKKYGELYLSPSELQAELTRVDRDLYAWLAYRFPSAKPAFWKYYEGGLKSIGEELDYARLKRAQWARWLRRLGNPLASFTAIAEARRSR